jgi:formamidopyrimidine-DNA glycosylase
MPELPEVETVRRGLENLWRSHPKIIDVKLKRKDLRFPFPKKLKENLCGRKILGVRRRAKYLLIDTEDGVLLSHLGMTGSWREVKLGEIDPYDDDPHSHVELVLHDGRKFIYRDPRRFGMLDYFSRARESTHPRLKQLGPEPLSEDFDGEYLFQKSRKRATPLKVFIMNQEVVVGVGNIYASEALFRAGIKPTKLAGKISQVESQKLVSAIKEVLKDAIEAGGSTISDFYQADGDEGKFQDLFRVYDRNGDPCATCKTKIKTKVIGGRSTYWCPSCQR